MQPLGRKASAAAQTAACARGCGGGGAAPQGASVARSSNFGENAAPDSNPTDVISMTVLTQPEARTDVLNRLRRAEGQIRGIQRMVEEGEDCLKIGQQFAAVRKALDSTYLRMTVCFMEQELNARVQPDESQKASLEAMVKDMETMLARLG